MWVVDGGAGLNEEEAELTGDGSIEEAESTQTAESKEDVELFKVVRAFIQGCWRHLAAVRRFLCVCVCVFV